MPGCCAVNCTNSDRKGFKMNIFPRDPQRRKEWAAKNYVFLVTGGSSGLGAATVKFLLEEGGKVVIFDTEPCSQNNYGDENNVLLIKGDVSSETDVTVAVNTVKKTFGKLNGIINCAGIYRHGKVYDFEKKESLDLKIFETVLRVNVLGTINIIRLFVPLLAENMRNEDGEKGVIINVASIAAFDWIGGSAAYSASKAAVAGMTMPLAKDLGDQGIRVVAIAPGIFDTPMVRDVFPNVDNFNKHYVFPKKVPLPTEFARFVKTIIETPSLNATTVRLDGGMRDINYNSRC